MALAVVNPVPTTTLLVTDEALEEFLPIIREFGFVEKIDRGAHCCWSITLSNEAWPANVCREAVIECRREISSDRLSFSQSYHLKFLGA